MHCLCVHVKCTKNYECALVSDQPRHSVQLCSHMHLQLAFVSRENWLTVYIHEPVLYVHRPALRLHTSFIRNTPSLNSGPTISTNHGFGVQFLHKSSWGRRGIYILCCREGHLDVVRYLVTEADCDPDVSNDDQDTPLHTACRYIHYWCLSYCPILLHLCA